MNRDKFISNLTLARKSRGLTQKETAEAVGVSDRTYSKWETGETEPGVDQLCRLAEFYGLSPAVFFAEDAPNDKSALRSELKTMTPVQAMLRARGLMDEAFDGLCDNGLYWNEKLFENGGEAERLWSEPLPAEAPPEGLVSGFVCTYNNSFFLRVWDKEINLRLLLMPAEDGVARLAEDAEETEELFSLLRRIKLLLPLTETEASREFKYFTPGYLAREAGLSPEEAAETLAAMERWGFCMHQEAETGADNSLLYHYGDTRILRALLTLIRLLLREKREISAAMAARKGGEGA